MDLKNPMPYCITLEDSHWVKLCERIEHDPCQKVIRLGAGGFANVYDLGDGRVLKLTSDYRDALLSNYFRLNPHPFIARCYDAFCIDPSQSRYDSWEGTDLGAYCLVNEKLQSLDDEWEDFIIECMSGRCPIKSYFKALDNDEYWKNYYSPKLGWLEQVATLYLDLELKTDDFRPCNIMMDNWGCAKVSDLGCTTWKRALPELEDLQ